MQFFFLIIQNIILSIITLIFPLLDDKQDQSVLTSGCKYISKWQSISRFWGTSMEGCALLFTLLFGYKLRKTGIDAFWIRNEFVASVYTVGLAQLLFIILLIFGLPRWITAFWVIFSIHCLILLAIVWPYFLNRKARNLQPISHISDKMNTLYSNLNDVITSPEGFQAFLEYLETEFSSENLLFWDAVKHLQKLDAEDPTSLERVQQIYLQYISTNSPYSINIPDSIHHSITLSYESVRKKAHNEMSSVERTEALHLFDEAEKEIFELMKSDSFPRFQRSRHILTLSSSSQGYNVGHVSHLSMEMSRSELPSPSHTLGLPTTHDYTEVPVTPPPQLQQLEQEEKTVFFSEGV